MGPNDDRTHEAERGDKLGHKRRRLEAHDRPIGGGRLRLRRHAGAVAAMGRRQTRSSRGTAAILWRLAHGARAWQRTRHRQGRHHEAGRQQAVHATHTFTVRRPRTLGKHFQARGQSRREHVKRRIAADANLDGLSRFRRKPTPHGPASRAAISRRIVSDSRATVSSSICSSRSSHAPRATAASVSSKHAALAPACSSSRRSRR